MKQKNVLEYLEATVRRLPDKEAYIDDNESLTFAQTYACARSVGSVLAGRGLVGEPVVVYMPKRPATVAAFFGCVYAGDLYVPIDPEMPKMRTELIFETLRPKVVLCDAQSAGDLKDLPFDGEILLYEEASKAPENAGLLAEIRARQIDTDPIYVVFTSGSTGVPKGVVACHRSVLDYIEQLSEVLGFSEETRFANQAPL